MDLYVAGNPDFFCRLHNSIIPALIKSPFHVGELPIFFSLFPGDSPCHLGDCGPGSAGRRQLRVDQAERDRDDAQWGDHHRLCRYAGA